MQELSDQSQTGTLIKSVAEGFRLDLGFDATLATIPWNKAKQYVTNTWYSYLSDFFADSNKGITGKTPKRIEIIDNIETMPYLRKIDCMIIKRFHQSRCNGNTTGDNKYNANEHKSNNAIRYLHGRRKNNNKPSMDISGQQ